MPIYLTAADIRAPAFRRTDKLAAETAANVICSLKDAAEKAGSMRAACVTEVERKEIERVRFFMIHRGCDHIVEEYV